MIQISLNGKEIPLWAGGYKVGRLALVADPEGEGEITLSNKVTIPKSFEFSPPKWCSESTSGSHLQIKIVVSSSATEFLLNKCQTSRHNPKSEFLQVADFFRPMDVGSGTRALQQSMEIIQLNVHWVKQNEESIFSWLEKNNFNQ